eukprot:6534022-Prymnesium_polylepis.1
MPLDPRRGDISNPTPVRLQTPPLTATRATVRTTVRHASHETQQRWSHTKPLRHSPLARVQRTKSES